MFGKLFNQKKEDGTQDTQTTEVAVQTQSGPVSGQGAQSDPNNIQSAQVGVSQNQSGVTSAGASYSQTTQPVPAATGANPNTAVQSAGVQAGDGSSQVSINAQTTDQQHPGAGLPKGQQAAVQVQAGAKVDMSPLAHLDPRASLVLNHSQEEARRIHQQYIEPEQLLLGLLYDEQVSKLLGEFSVDVGKLSKEIQAKERMGSYQGQPVLSQVSQQVFEQAYRDAKMRGSAFIAPEDILIVLFTPNYNTEPMLKAQGLKKDVVVEKLSKSSTGGFGRKSTLEKYAIDLTQEAREGKLDPVAGREKEVDRIVHILLRRTKNNPIIIGETGVGKTAIVEGLAQKIVANGVPKDLLNKRLFQLDVASLVAGASHRGEFEERLKAVVSEVLGSNGTIILFIDEIHSLMGAGESEGMNAANIIKPYLARGQLQIIGATTTTEYRKHFEKDKAFERRFQPVTAEEPSDENALEMMKVLRPKYEKFHKVKIPDDALKQSIKLAKKYIGERYLPDKAVDLLDEGCSEVKLQVDGGKRGDSEVKKSDIEKVVSAWTGIPITKLTEDESEKLLKLEDRIHQRLIDQEEAVVAVSEAVRRGRIGLASGQRPTASFIFLGPTGVGKTELAKTLAELLFGRDDAMARLDMSEFMEKHEVAKLIGAPPGYVGYEEGGVLTEAVRKKPYSIVLMDEIEKAHPDVFNVLLQLLEDGRLTDNKGNVISFKNTIVICTSNIGSAMIQQYLSKQDKNVKLTGEQATKQFGELQKIVKEELIKFLRPEVLNRFDEVVIFKPLRPEHMAGIVRLEMAKIAKLLKEQGYMMQITEKAVAKLAKDGYDPVYGARPLRRLIQTAVENPIALAIIAKKFSVGDTIVIDYNEDVNEFIFSKGGQKADSADLSDAEFKVILQKIADPVSIKSDYDKEIFGKLHEKVVTASNGLNPVYTVILAVNSGTTDKEAGDIREKLIKAKTDGDALAGEILDIAAGVVQQLKALEKQKKILIQLVNPELVTSALKRSSYKELHDRIVVESQNNNKLAASILSVKQESTIDEVGSIFDELNKGKLNENEFATEILSFINNEITQEAQKQTEAQPATKFKKFMRQIGNPLYLAEPENKKKFSDIHDKINEAGRQNHPLAERIMSITDITSDEDIAQLQMQLEDARKQGDPLAAEILAVIQDAVAQNDVIQIKTPLLYIVNPLVCKTPEEKELFTSIHTKVDDAAQKGNKVASSVLSVNDASTPEDIKALSEQLFQAKQQNDEIASLIIDAIEASTGAVVGSISKAQPEVQAQGMVNAQQPTTGPDVQAQDAVIDQLAQPGINPADPAQNFPFGTAQQAPVSPMPSVDPASVMPAPAGAVNVMPNQQSMPSQTNPLPADQAQFANPQIQNPLLNSQPGFAGDPVLVTPDNKPQ